MANQESGFSIPLPPESKRRKVAATQSKLCGQENEKGIESRIATRSVKTPVDWSKCFICKNKTYKKETKLINLCSFEARDSIRKAAELKNDDDMLHSLRSVNYDLIAAEAKYHKNCYALYTSKKSLKLQEHKGDSLHEITFQDMVKEIEVGIDCGKAYDMASLLDTYKRLLKNNGADGASYTKQHLKVRLQKHFGESIVFHQPPERKKSELVYSSKIKVQDVLNAWASHQQTAKQGKEPDEVKKEDIVRVAKYLRGELRKCEGISTRPLDIKDISAESANQEIPDCLYWLLQTIIRSEDKNSKRSVERSSSVGTCGNTVEERQILSIAQDIIHCCNNSRVKLPKHIGLAMCVYHLTSSRQLITLLNKMGHCSSYDDVRVVDTSIAMEVLAKAEEYGTVIPSNILPGAFVQLAADNNDLNEETLDGKNTTHATTMVVYQRKVFGPAPPTKPLADHRNRRRSLQTSSSVYELQDCSAHGRRPSVTAYVNEIDTDWYKGEDTVFKHTGGTDMVWKLLRLDPASTELSEKQPIPGWSGFNSILFPDLPGETNIGYCPMINADSTEFSTIYTVLKHAQMVSASLGQQDTVITFDLLIYIKAKQIQWRYPEEFADVVIRMGGFHIALNFLSLIGKKYLNSGVEDLLIESGVYAAGTTTNIMKGKSYNRGVRAHKLLSEAFFRLMWKAFETWFQTSHPNKRSIAEEYDLLEISNVVHAVENYKEGNAIKAVQDLEGELKGLTSSFEAFVSERTKKSKMFAFWSEYCDMVNVLLQFIKAERTGNWNLHLHSVAALVPYFFAMDRQNYARWLPVYLADMHQLEEKHPMVHSDFIAGGHGVSRSGQPFSTVWSDMALEQSVNADSKSAGGIIGKSQNASALEKWFLTVHERATIAAALKEMYGVQNAEQGTHKEASPSRVKRDEEDIKKLVSCFTSGLMISPFDDAEDLANFATGIVLPTDVAEALVSSTKKGKDQMENFIAQRLNSNTIGFWEPIPSLKVKTFSSITKKVQVKVTNEKLVTVSADRDIFGRLLISCAANARLVDLREVLTYELSPIPCSLAHNDGTLRKTTKSVLMSIMEKEVNVQPRLPESILDTTHITDGMAIVQMTKFAGATKFGDLSQKYYSIFTAPLNLPHCNEVHIVFDQYLEVSIKAGERAKRGASNALEVQIAGPSTPVPKQWKKYITNEKNKINLCEFLTNSICKLGQKLLPRNKRVLIGGGLKDGKRCVLITRGCCRDVEDLKSDHEEADTRLLLHAKYVSQSEGRVVIQSPDTDVLVLGVAFYHSLGCAELWFRTGVKDKLRFLPVHDISHELGEQMCNALPALHALTGCDSNSSLAGVGKKKAWELLKQSNVHQESLSLLGQDPLIDGTIANKCEAFICDLYPCPRKSQSTADERRYVLFCQKQKNEKLPPTSDSLRQHMQRANYQTYVWRHSLTAMQILPSPVGHGWTLEDGILQPVLMTKDPAPKSLLELTTCNCKKTECLTRCSCNTTGLACTEACNCMGDCKTPHGLCYGSDSDESDTDDF